MFSMNNAINDLELPRHMPGVPFEIQLVSLHGISGAIQHLQLLLPQLTSVFTNPWCIMSDGPFKENRSILKLSMILCKMSE